MCPRCALPAHQLARRAQHRPLRPEAGFAHLGGAHSRIQPGPKSPPTSAGVRGCGWVCVAIGIQLVTQARCAAYRPCRPCNGTGEMLCARWAMARLTWRIVTLPCVAAVLAGLLIAGCGRVRLTGERSAVAVPRSAVPASAIPRLKAIADQLAKENGDAVPSRISAKQER